jgi:hypothetical protein
MPLSTFLKMKTIFPLLLVPVSRFWALKTHFRIERHENKEKRLFYFGLRIRLAIQIQLLEFKIPKDPKIDSPYHRIYSLLQTLSFLL